MMMLPEKKDPLPGKLIVLEGIDGSGKTSHLAYLKEALKERLGGVRLLTLREPGGTAWGESLRSVLLDFESSERCPLAEALLFASCRAQLIHEKVQPALKQGAWVLLDRYTLSTLAYQGARGLPKATLETLNHLSSQGIPADLTLYFSITPEISWQRRKQARDRMEAEPPAFLKRVHQLYQDLMVEVPNLVTIDASQPLEVVHHAGLSAIVSHFSEFSKQ